MFQKSLEEIMGLCSWHAYITLFVDMILSISNWNSYLLWLSKTAVLLNILTLLSYISIHPQEPC